MLKAILSLLMPLCCMTARSEECKEIAAKESKRKLIDYLLKDRSHLSLDCVWKTVRQADTIAGDLDVARAFVRLLDYTGLETAIAQRPLVTNRQLLYPAMGGLMIVGKSAEPLLLEALTEPEISDVARKNAAIMVFLLNRHSIMTGAKHLASAYWSVTDQGVAKRVLDAVIEATKACGTELRVACQAEIFRKPAP